MPSSDPSCTRCELHASAKTVCVAAQHSSSTIIVPHLNGQSGVLIVGQNPGSQEDREGVPFIGPSGKLVRDLLEGREYVITNAVKCYTKGNREPTLQESTACRPHLIAELVTLRPEKVMALGNTALKTLTGKSGVTNLRGQPHDLRADITKALVDAGIPKEKHPKVYATVHPAYVLRNPGAIEIMREDVAGLYRPVDDTPVPWEYSLVSPTSVSAFDIESTGVNYRSPSFGLHMIGVDDGTDTIQILRRPGQWAHLAVMAERVAPVQPATFNGLAFDQPALRWKFKYKGEPVNDVMLLAFLMDETMPHHTLQACATRWLGVAPWKDNLPWTWEAGPQNEEEWAAMAQYCARDVRYTRLLWEKLWSGLSSNLKRVYRYLLVPSVLSLSQMTEAGAYVMKENLQLARTETQQEIERSIGALRSYAQVFGLNDFNPNSTAQVRKMLYEHLGLPTIKSTGTGLASTDNETLKTLSSKAATLPEEEQALKAWEFTQALLTYRGANKLETSILAPYEEKTEDDGRVHSSYSVINTETGRTSAHNPNIQQLPRKSSIRRIIGAPPGYKLIVADQSQIELRMAAWFSRDENMLACYKGGMYGGDLHAFMAQQILTMQGKQVAFDKALHKHERTLAKAVNFGCLYGAEPFTVQAYLWKAYGLKVTLLEAAKLRDQFFYAFPKLTTYYDAFIAEVRKTGIVTTPLGRIRHLPNINAGDIELRAEAARQAINTPNQATASDISLVGLNICVERNKNLRPIAFIHDCNIFEVKDEYVEQAAENVQVWMGPGTLDYLVEKFNVVLDVPLEVEITVCQEWG